MSMKSLRRRAMRVRIMPAVLLLLALTLISAWTPLQGWTGDRLTRQQAEGIVKKLPQVEKDLAVGSPPCKLLLDDEEPHRYVFRLVLFLPGTDGDPPRSTCIGWYAVDKKTRRAYEFTPGID